MCFLIDVLELYPWNGANSKRMWVFVTGKLLASFNSFSKFVLHQYTINYAESAYQRITCE